MNHVNLPHRLGTRAAVQKQLEELKEMELSLKLADIMGEVRPTALHCKPFRPSEFGLTGPGV